MLALILYYLTILPLTSLLHYHLPPQYLATLSPQYLATLSPYYITKYCIIILLHYHLTTLPPYCIITILNYHLTTITTLLQLLPLPPYYITTLLPLPPYYITTLLYYHLSTYHLTTLPPYYITTLLHITLLH